MTCSESLTLYGISLLCFFERQEIDMFNHKDGHYTIPGKWVLSDVEHMGESIHVLIDDALLYRIEREYNAKHA